MPTDLYILIHNLRVTETRYIISKGRKEEGLETDYLKIFKAIKNLETYKEEEYTEAINRLKLKGSIETKKHYLDP